MLERDTKGKFVKGMTMSAERREAIARGQMARHQRNRAQQGSPPKTKICSQCGKRKRVPQDYTMRRRRLKSGDVTVYPAGECKSCARERAAAWKAALGKEEADRRQKVYERNYRNKDPERFKRMQRESSRAARERAGVKPRGPWKKYREPELNVLVDPALFLEWLHWAGVWRPVNQHEQWTEGCGVRLDPADQRAIIRCATQNEQGIWIKRHAGVRMELVVIDRIMTRAGTAGQLAVFYPPEKLKQVA